jgi:hypothetical protein
MMFISSVQYLRGISSSSFLGSRMLDVAPSTYEWLWANIGSKFAPGEKFNKTIYEIREGYQKL